MLETQIEAIKFGDHVVRPVFPEGDEKVISTLKAHEKGDQDYTNTNELNNLRKKMAALSCKDIQTYFGGLREIIADVKTKADVCEERILYLKQDLPFKMEHINKLRTRISEEGQKAREVLQEYKQKRNAVIEELKNNAPDLLTELNRYSNLTSELQLLLFTRSFLQAKKELKGALADENIPALHNALISLQKEPEFILKSEDKKVFDREYKKLLDEAKAFLKTNIVKQLKSIGYPFDDDCELCLLTTQTENIVEVLECYLAVVCDESAVDRSSSILPFFLDPLKQRFVFHFLKESKTNVDDKPEWFFTLLMSWITANLPFLKKLCQLLFAEEKEVSLNTVRGFQNFIIGLGKQKMLDILSRISNDKVNFSHLIDEAVLFEKDLRESRVLCTEETVLDVLLKEPFLDSWIDLETKSSRSSVESFLSSEARWKQRYREVADTDPFRVPECTDQFILLLDSITERYRWISDVQIQAKFFSIQLLMLEEFHLRLVQISQHLPTPWEEPFMQTLNSFWYISCVMEEWAYADVFISVQMHNAGSRSKGAFVELAEIYKHVWHQRVTDMCAAFAEQIQSQLTKYRNVKWFAITVTKPNDITPSFCPFFLEVRRLMGRVAAAVSPNSAIHVLRMLNSAVAEVLRDLIADTSFNCNGASQMLYDLNTCLLPLLNSIYSEATSGRFEALDEPLFRDVIVSLTLLSLPVAPATLLRNELKQSPEEMAPGLLANYHASTLTRDQVLSLFKQRCDLQFDSGISVSL